jgi:hypothetical protein
VSLQDITIEEISVAKIVRGDDGRVVAIDWESPTEVQDMFGDGRIIFHRLLMSIHSPERVE